MTTPTSIDPSTTAVVLIEYQNEFASPGGVLGFFADTEVSPAPAQWGPIGPKALWLEAPKAVSQLDDEAVLAKLSLLLGH